MFVHFRLVMPKVLPCLLKEAVKFLSWKLIWMWERRGVSRSPRPRAMLTVMLWQNKLRVPCAHKKNCGWYALAGHLKAQWSVEELDSMPKEQPYTAKSRATAVSESPFTSRLSVFGMADDKRGGSPNMYESFKFTDCSWREIKQDVPVHCLKCYSCARFTHPGGIFVFLTIFQWIWVTTRKSFIHSLLKTVLNYPNEKFTYPCSLGLIICIQVDTVWIVIISFI